MVCGGLLDRCKLLGGWVRVMQRGLRVLVLVEGSVEGRRSVLVFGFILVGEIIKFWRMEWRLWNEETRMRRKNVLRNKISRGFYKRKTMT